jgi:hypothetical protein
MTAILSLYAVTYDFSPFFNGDAKVRIQTIPHKRFAINFKWNFEKGG